LLPLAHLLPRMLTSPSRAQDLRRSLSRPYSLHAVDPEKQDPSSSSFDLLLYLRAEANEADAAGLKRKALGVAWTGLQVVGNGGAKVRPCRSARARPLRRFELTLPSCAQLYIPTFLDACRDWVTWPVHQVGKLCGRDKAVPKHLLESFDGCLKPGEMCLVLGRPGSGCVASSSLSRTVRNARPSRAVADGKSRPCSCSTFLKTIANQRSGYLAVNGNVSYGGISSSHMAKRYRGEVVYNAEDDVHAATLTVAQTLAFALKLKTPGTLPPGKTKRELEHEVLGVVLRMLGISHTRDTKVGSAYERGVSGGERKRVSIAEMMATRACVCSWDNSTRGLDASTALDYAKALRVLTDVHQMATFVSLYQAGEGIYDQFDKVLVIDEGRQVFFGKASEARQYMVRRALTPSADPVLELEALTLLLLAVADVARLRRPSSADVGRLHHGLHRPERAQARRRPLRGRRPLDVRGARRRFPALRHPPPRARRARRLPCRVRARREGAARVRGGGQGRQAQGRAAQERVHGVVRSASLGALDQAVRRTSSTRPR